MNWWRQTKIYECLACGVRYLHDRARHHALYACRFRPTMNSNLSAIGGRSLSEIAEALIVQRESRGVCG